AIMAGIALAWSGGVAMHIRIMRTELLSAGFVTSALLLVLIAGRAAGLRRTVLVAFAGLSASLAVITKVQALLPALAIPIIALAFGQTEPTDKAEQPTTARRWLVPAIAVFLAIAAAYPAAALILQGMARAGVYRPLGGGLSGVYQWLIVLWVAGAIAIYAAVWRVAVPDAVAGVAAVALGIALGILTLDIRYQVQNAI